MWVTKRESQGARRLGTLAAAGAVCLAGLAVPGAPMAQAATVTFSTPGSHTWTVPAGVSRVTVEVAGGGGAGGHGSGAAIGGRGAVVTATLSVTPGQVLSLYVGGGGLNGGAGGGGGASWVDDSAGVVIVAGGGGGGGGAGGGGWVSGTGAGGDGGTPNGQDGASIVNSNGRNPQGGAGGAGGNGGTGGTGFSGPCGANDAAPGGSGTGGAGGASGGGGAGGSGSGSGTGGNGSGGRWAGGGGGGYGGGGGGGGGCVAGGGDAGGGGGGSTGPDGATYSLADNSGSVGAAGGDGWIMLTPLTPPTPPPPIPAMAPLDVTATAGDRSAVLTWSAPVSTGSFPVTHYQAVGSPSGSCLVAAPMLSCEVTGLRNRETHSFRVRALTGAGWGSWSDPVSVTPVAPDPSIVISGSRDGKQVVVEGVMTGMPPEQVTPWVRSPGPHSYEPQSVVRKVSASGEFTWQRDSAKKMYVYVRAGDARSNRVIIPAR